MDYSPENNAGEVQSGDEEDGEGNNDHLYYYYNIFTLFIWTENSKSFMMDDEYSSNNSNADLSVLPVGINSFANQFVNTAGNNNLNGSGGNVSRTIEG